MSASRQGATSEAQTVKFVPIRVAPSRNRILKAVVLTFDRLPTHLLGCYGNEWTETPGFDRLASLGSVFDQHFAEVPGPVGPNHSWWTGQFEYFSKTPAKLPTETPDSVDSGQNWLKRLGECGVKCRLLAEKTEGLPTDLFYSSEAVGGVTGLNAQHEDVPIARLVQRGIEILNNSGGLPSSPDSADESKPELLWLHSAGVPSPWLPPRLFAELYLDELEEIVDGESGRQIASDLVSQFENDPDLVKLLLSDWRHEAEEESGSEDDTDRPPKTDLDDIDSPELERQISRLVFAGYVSMIDRWLLKLLDTIENSDEQILLVVSANEGHTFGEAADLESDTFGSSSRNMNADPESNTGQLRSFNDAELRTPLIIARLSRSPDEQEFGSRHSALVQPVDLATTVEDWFNCDADGTSREAGCTVGQSLLEAISGRLPESRPLALCLGPGGEIGVHNRSWLLTTSTESMNDNDAMDSDVRLFAKPDDQWDVHDVSSQYRQEVDLLLTELRQRFA